MKYFVLGSVISCLSLYSIGATYLLIRGGGCCVRSR